MLGSFTTRGLAGSIARFAGVSESAAKSLLGMLGPMVLGVLGQQQRSMGLDANGLAELLTSQQGQIVQAIPAGLADELDGAGLLDLFEGSPRNIAAAATSSVRNFGHAPARSAAGSVQATHPGRSGGAQMWPFWVAGLVVLAALAWYFLGGHSGDQVAEQTHPTQPAEHARATTGVAGPNLTVGGFDLSNQIDASVGAVRTALTGITDVASAEAALPKIRDATAQLDRINALAAQLPAESRSALARLIAAATPTINQLCEKALAMPGVGSVAKPTIDELRARLDTLTRA